ncbi:MAG: hypothetical protein QOI46_4864, partial [Alphaproteobacteria bacterium]|nr:hypothetical protein [Alphaproteobacteria bacterium]
KFLAPVLGRKPERKKRVEAAE